MTKQPRRTDPGSNDPPRAHPNAGTGEFGTHAQGAAGGGAAGGAMGSASGPLGTLAGALIGGLAGGLAGKQVAGDLNPTNPLAEHAYWSQNYRFRPYVAAEEEYELFGPAYQRGWEAYHLHPGKSFEEIAPELQEKWESHEAKPSLEWERAREAARDAWQRLHDRRRELGDKPE